MQFDKSFIAASIAAVLMTGVSAAVVAKTAEDDSVYRWGRWAVLAPAAGAEESLIVPPGANDLDRCASEANCPGPVASRDPDPEVPTDPPPVDPPPVDPPPVDPPPVDPPPIDPPPIDPPPIDPPPVDPPPVDPPPVDPPKSEARPVGFARIDYRDGQSGAVYRSYYGDIVLNNDGDGHRPVLDEGDAGQSLAFRVAGQSGPDGNGFNEGTGPLSVTVGSDHFNTPHRARFYIDGDDYVRDAEGNLALVDGTWWQIGEDGSKRSGQYVWGVPASDMQLSALMDQLSGTLGGDLTGFYSGRTQNLGFIELEMNFTQSSWNGNVQGTVVEFQAGGDIEGARFSADQFSSNISHGKMEGALVNGGLDAIGGFDVKDQSGLLEADVFKAGLITEPRS